MNRFGNAVANGWKSVQSKGIIQTGKDFVSDITNKAAASVTAGAKRVAASVRNLVEGAGRALLNASIRVEEAAKIIKETPGKIKDAGDRAVKINESIGKKRRVSKVDKLEKKLRNR